VRHRDGRLRVAGNDSILASATRYGTAKKGPRGDGCASWSGWDYPFAYTAAALLSLHIVATVGYHLKAAKNASSSPRGAEVARDRAGRSVALGVERLLLQDIGQAVARPRAANVLAFAAPDGQLKGAESEDAGTVSGS
jgi:hypothetical protein